MGIMNATLMKEYIAASLWRFSEDEIENGISVFHQTGVSLIEGANDSGYDDSDIMLYLQSFL